jgi:hypothetical protein
MLRIVARLLNARAVCVLDIVTVQRSIPLTKFLLPRYGAMTVRLDEVVLALISLAVSVRPFSKRRSGSG